MSIWVIADFDTPRGERILYEALTALVSQNVQKHCSCGGLTVTFTFQDENATFRLSFLHSPSGDTPPSLESLSQRLALLQAADILGGTSPTELSLALQQWDKYEGGANPSLMNVIASINEESMSSSRNLHSRTKRLLRAMNIQAGQYVVLANGRVCKNLL